MYTRSILLVILTLSFFNHSFAQEMGINVDPDASAIFHVQSTDRGVLIPRMDSAQRVNIANPALGLLVFDTDSNSFWYHVGGVWRELRDHDWYKEGSTQAPTSIEDDIYHQGNVAIGKVNANFPLDIEGLQQRGLNLNSTYNSPDATSPAFGIYLNLDHSGIADTYGMRQIIAKNSSNFKNVYGTFSTISGNADDKIYGTRNGITSTSGDDHYGVYNNLVGGQFPNISNSNHYGVYNFLGGIPAGAKYGVFNEIIADDIHQVDKLRFGVMNKIKGPGDGEKYGTYNDISGSANGEHYGTYNLLNENNNAGNHWGTYSDMTSDGDGDHHGSHNLLSGAGSGIKYGTKNEVSGTGNGQKYGVYNSLSGSTNGNLFGTYNMLSEDNNSGIHWGTYNRMSGAGPGRNEGSHSEMDGSGDGNQFGFRAKFTNTGTGDHIGLFNSFNTIATGTHYGVKNEINHNGDNVQYGAYNDLDGNGSGTHYGTRNKLRGAGLGDRYGSYNSIANGGTGMHVAGYFDAPGGDNDFAAIFNAGHVVMNESGGGNDVRVESADLEHLLFADGSANRIGIGTGTPDRRLEVEGIDFNGAIAKFENVSANSDADGILIKMGVSPSASSNNFFIVFRDGDNDLTGSISGDGSGGVLYNNTSDRRLKQNIRPYTSGLDLTMQIQPRIYERKVNPGVDQIGFIAQEMYEVLPEIVSGTPASPADQPMSLDYSKLTPILVSAIQEQQQMIQDLLSRIESLESQSTD